MRESGDADARTDGGRIADASGGQVVDIGLRGRNRLLQDGHSVGLLPHQIAQLNGPLGS